MEIDNVEDALNDAKLAVEYSTQVSMDIKNILIRLRDELGQRSISHCSKLVAESMDTITDL